MTLKASIKDTFVFYSGSGAFVVPYIIDPRSRTSVVITIDFYSYSQVWTTWIEAWTLSTFSFSRALVGAQGTSLGPPVLHEGLRDGPKF